MNLENLTWIGPNVDDRDILTRLPDSLADLIRKLNGFIQYHGGLHVRGACRNPAWHSLRSALEGDDAFCNLYPDVTPDDIPFAEDCMGDQFILRNDTVWQLSCETGELVSLDVDLATFLIAIEEDPVEALSMHPLMQFESEGSELKPGQLLSADPPFCTEQAEDGVSLQAVDALEQRRFLADLAQEIRDLPEGEAFGLDITE